MRFLSFLPLPLSLLILSTSGFAQKEFLATVDRTSCNIEIVDSLPEVMWINVLPRMSTFDEISKHFLFSGEDRQEVNRLYSVDAVTGSIVHSPPFPVLSDPRDNVALLEFDNGTGTLYAVHWDMSAMMEYLVTLDPATGVHTIIDSLPDVLYIHTACFNENLGQYYLHATDKTNKKRMYVIDAATGQVFSDPQFPAANSPDEQVFDLQFDHSTNTLYGLFWNSPASEAKMVSINPGTGNHTVLYPVPNVDAGSFPPNTHFFDEAKGHYTFRADHTSNPSRLYTMDVATGALLHDPIYPGLPHAIDNLIEFNYDQSTGILYALHWDHEFGVGIPEPTQPPGLSVFPNPFRDRTTIQLDNLGANPALRLVDELGRVVAEWKNLPATTIEFQNDQLAAGVYFLEVRSEGERLVQKVVVQ